MNKILRNESITRDINWNYKLILSIILGMFGFVGTLFAIKFSYGDVSIIINWSLVFPVLVALAWGRRYGQISVCLGLAVFYPFLLGHYNGWACFATAFMLFAWVTIIGWGRDKRFSEKMFYTNTYFLQFVYSVLRVALYFSVFPLLYMLNPPFWYPAANTSIAFSTIAVFAIKSFIIDFLLLAVADVLLLMPFVRRLLRLDCPKNMRYNSHITLLVFLLFLLFRAIMISSDYFLVQKDYSLRWLINMLPGDMVFLMWAAFAGLIIGGIIGRFFSARLEIKDSLEDSEKKYREIFNDFTDIYLETDAVGIIHTISPSVAQILGYRADDMIGTNVTSYYYNQDVRPIVIEELRLLNTIGNIHIEMRGINNKKHDLLFNIKLIRFENGDEKFISIARDVTQYQESVEKTRAAEKKYSLLFNTMINVIIIVEPVYDENDQLVDYRYVDANTAYESYSGRQKNEVLGRTFSEVHGMRNRYLDTYEKVFKTGEPQRFIANHPKNHDVFELVRVFRFGNSQAALLFDNITDRIQMEKELQRVGDNLTAILESTDDLIWSVDRNFEIVQYNTALRRYVLESDGKEVRLGMRMNELMDEKRAAFWAGHYERAIVEGKYRIDIPTKYGDRFYSVSFSPIYIEGEISLISIFAKEITHRIEMENDLKLISANLTSIIESTDDMIWSVDSSYAIAHFNSALKNYIEGNYHTSVTAGRKLHELMDADRADYWTEQFDRAVEEGQYKFDIATKYGNKILTVSMNPIYRDGELHEISIFEKDITLRVRMEKEILQLNTELEKRVEERTTELQHALAELEAFTYTVSHDLKSPLRAIEAYSGILLADGPCDDRLAETASHIRHISSDMLAFIGKLLQYTTAARYEISRETIDLFEMIRTEFNEITEVSGRTIELVIDDDIPPVKTDRFLLKQVLTNILSNAVKFTKTREHAVITVTCDISSHDIVLCFADNGVGFNMLESHKLFRVFQRLHPPHEFEGTGIGLATVKKFITKLGGRTWIEGEPGKGAAVYITLPLTKLH